MVPAQVRGPLGPGLCGQRDGRSWHKQGVPGTGWGQMFKGHPPSLKLTVPPCKLAVIPFKISTRHSPHTQDSLSFSDKLTLYTPTWPLSRR